MKVIHTIRIHQYLTVDCTFDAVDLPDQDYDLELSSMIIRDEEGDEVLLSDFSHDEQESLLTEINDSIDLYLDENHERIYNQLTASKASSQKYLH